MPSARLRIAASETLPDGTPSAPVTAATSAPDASSSERTSRSDVAGDTTGAPGGGGVGAAASPAVISASRLSARSAPTNSAMNSSFGAASSRSGGSHCTSEPSFMMATRSPIRIASSMSCVTKITVLRRPRRMARNSDCSRVRTIGSTAPNGSSISMTGGSAASARATPTR